LLMSGLPMPGLPMSGLPRSGLPRSGLPMLGRVLPGPGRVSPLEISPRLGRPTSEATLPKLGRLLLPGNVPGREAIGGILTLGRLILGLEPTLLPGLLLAPSEGREAAGLGLGRGAGRLLTLGSEGRLDGVEMFGLGRDIPGLGRDAPGLGRDMPPEDMPPLGRPPPPIPIDGRAPPPPPPPPPGPRRWP
jgi:hypothetical protein